MANPITVKVGKVPGSMNDYATTDEDSIQSLFDEIGMDSDGFEVRVNSNPVTDLSRNLRNGDIVLLMRKVKGA